ncbi:unnamed protein product [Rhizoctonia solani]|uniref:Ribosomal RNA methyltransferase FtsJ domain-containing protein n=1 Tax=Rhizoctonia solani TaxID=456999 RepID=A0A8H3GA33_9AGAM|nr:unnamed protein product [Rhizoctonia solani]
MTQFLPLSPTFESADVEPKSKRLGNALMQREDCRDLCLLNATRAMGWSSSAVHHHFRKQRHHSDYIKHDTTVELTTFQYVLSEPKYLERLLRFVRTDRFLDLGCNPGGYSVYILRTCPMKGPAFVPPHVTFIV